MKGLNIEASLLKRTTSEFSRFLTCCLNSNRTPEELLDGLRDDLEMRDEVVGLLVSRIGASETTDVRLLLDRMLSGDGDLMRLLVDSGSRLRVLAAPWPYAL